MKAVNWFRQESVALIEMCHGDNKYSFDFIEQMNQCIGQVLGNKNIFSIVLTSSDEKTFSQGVDIEWVGQKLAEQDFESIKTMAYQIDRLFKTILLLPVPVIAAINGHAFGGGAILACACDFRFMRLDKGFFCFSEVNVNVPPFPGMIAIARKAIPEPVFNDMILSGKPYTGAQLEEWRVIVKACEGRENLISEVIEYAKFFQKPRPIFGELKRRMHKEIIRIIDQDDPEYIEAFNIVTPPEETLSRPFDY